MPYVSATTRLQGSDPQTQSQSLRSPVLISFDALARSQLNPDDPLTRRLSSFLSPQSKCDLQKRQCRLVPHTSPRAASPTCRPLKSCLKCSRARRIISEPATPRPRSPDNTSPPPSPKCVRFNKDSDLESVRLFRATGRPASISLPRSYSDTETETDTDSALSAQRGPKMAPFTMTDMSPLPSPHTPPDSNVHLESLTLLPARPALLRGTVRVRNLAFEKNVAVRFTTDGWATVSEVQARYVRPAPRTNADTDADAHTDADTDSWDLFAFTIPLESPSPRTLLLAVRYVVPGAGEWWDNNGGADFRVVLAQATPTPTPTPTPRRLAPVVPGGATLAFGVGVGSAARARRSLVNVCRANVASVKAYAHPTTLPQCIPPVPPATSQRLRVS